MPEPKKLACERLSTFRKSASNTIHSAIASLKRLACVLHTTQYALTAYSLVRPAVQCSMLACCHLHTSNSTSNNANANRPLVPQYRNVSAVVNLRVVGKRCQTSCTTSTTMVQSCSTVSVTLCILHFAGRFPHTIRSTFRSQSLPRFHYVLE